MREPMYLKSWMRKILIEKKKKSSKSTRITPLFHSRCGDGKGALPSANRPQAVVSGTSAGETGQAMEGFPRCGWSPCLCSGVCAPRGAAEKGGGSCCGFARGRSPGWGHGCINWAAFFGVCRHSQGSTSKVRQQKRCCRRALLCGTWNVWSGEGAWMQN